MEEEKLYNMCDSCEKKISGKPWMTVLNAGIYKHVCCHTCANTYTNKYGGGYWDQIVNKEDFNEPRPVLAVYKNKHQRKDITSGFDMEEVRRELEIESSIESDYDYGYDEVSTTDEDEFYEENY